MTEPSGETMPLPPSGAPLLTDYISLGFNPGEVEAKWRELPVSRAGNPKWTVINWDTEYADPAGHHANNGGWTVLQGPCSYSLDVHVRCKELEPGCSVHVQAYVVTKDAAGVQTIVGVREAPERFVGAYETSHTHVDGSFMGVLYPGQFLQVRVDYWNAGRNPDGTLQAQNTVRGYIVGASVLGFWGPIPT